MLNNDKLFLLMEAERLKKIDAGAEVDGGDDEATDYSTGTDDEQEYPENADDIEDEENTQDDATEEDPEGEEEPADDENTDVTDYGDVADDDGNENETDYGDTDTAGGTQDADSSYGSEDADAQTGNADEQLEQMKKLALFQDAKTLYDGIVSLMERMTSTIHIDPMTSKIIRQVRSNLDILSQQIYVYLRIFERNTYISNLYKYESYNKIFALNVEMLKNIDVLRTYKKNKGIK